MRLKDWLSLLSNLEGLGSLHSFLGEKIDRSCDLFVILEHKSSNRK